MPTDDGGGLRFLANLLRDLYHYYAQVSTVLKQNTPQVLTFKLQSASRVHVPQSQKHSPLVVVDVAGCLHHEEITSSATGRQWKLEVHPSTESYRQRRIFTRHFAPRTSLDVLLTPKNDSLAKERVSYVSQGSEESRTAGMREFSLSPVLLNLASSMKIKTCLGAYVQAELDDKKHFKQSIYQSEALSFAFVASGFRPVGLDASHKDPFRTTAHCRSNQVVT
ncbi:hypothetical protein BDY19DRAFT_1049000 [Irpex rosettiformis]|uniref:Uncharacterized protein n=1 Tax=Irpex rosettiformis TaxID=378272 RepID=A0ACB8U1A9_9APHY|nr:hypothetical protein BDY19DRAFT_1049000 [Irpex rosettiformis]